MRNEVSHFWDERIAPDRWWHSTPQTNSIRAVRPGSDPGLPDKTVIGRPTLDKLPNMIAGNNPSLFHSPHPLGHRRQDNPLCLIRQRKTRIGWAPQKSPATHPGVFCF
jgi:hypothetical protein